MVKKKVKKTKITGAAAVLAVFSFLSYGLGLIRDRLLATTFGAGKDLDVYQASFLIPDIILNVFIAGALASAVVPVLSDYYAKKKEKEANQCLSFLSNVISIIVIAISLISFFLMPHFSEMIAPGFENEKKDLLVLISRLMLFSPFLFGLSNLIGGALLSLKKFVAYSISPVLYNGGIVLSIIFLAPNFGIKGVAIGTIFGAFLHLIVRLVSLYRLGFKYTFTFYFSPGSKKAFKLMLPRIFALFSWQGTLWAFTYVGSKLTEGSVSIFNLARNFQSLPVSLIGISIATAAFPFLAADFSKKQKKKFQNHFESSFNKIIFLVFPATVLMALLSYQIVSILIGGGEFDPEAVAVTSGVLALFALVIPFESLNHLLSRTFYSRHNTFTPVVIYIISMIVTIVGCFSLTRFFGIHALPLSFLIGAFIQTIILIVVLKTKADIALRGIAIYAVKALLLILLMSSAVFSLLKFLRIDGTIMGQILIFSLSSSLGLFIYIGFAFVLKFEEVKKILKVFKSWLKKVGLLLGY